MKYSAIIPAFNEEKIIKVAINQTANFFKKRRLSYEVLVINDGSYDNTWNIVKKIAQKNSKIKAINLLKNYGQHNAVLCGLQNTSGNYAITLDADLQNPPEEIARLIKKANEGHDLVMGRYRKKKHSFYRNFGTKIIWFVNKRVFDVPENIVLTNFRIIKADVVKRMCLYKTNYPYIQGLAIMSSSNPANVWVKHRKRAEGKSQYSIEKLTELTTRILFNYSSYPLRIVSIVGLVISVVSFILGAFFLIKALIVGSQVPGWSSLAILLAVFNGFSLLILGMLGEYLVRLLNQTSSDKSYQIKESINFHA